MNSTFLKKVLPHIIAIAVFLLVAVIFGRTALESGLTLVQSDIVHWKGMAQQSLEYREAHGHLPLWATSMFSGMPGYTFAQPGAWTPIGIIQSIMTLGLPKPISFFFLSCIGFYIFCMCIRIRPLVAIIGSLAFAYCSYSPILASAGHDTKILSLAFTPALLGALILIYEKKYLWGFILTAVFTMMQVGMNHQQISYYFFIIAAIATIAYLYQWIKAKEYTHIFKALGLAVLAAAIGIGVTSVNLFSTYELSKHSNRGGELKLDKTEKEDLLDKDGKTKGLTKEYAFDWSYGRLETFTLLFPGINGYGSKGATLDENSHLAKYLEEKANYSTDQAAQAAESFSGALYWGDQPFTEGPVYLGAVVCMLFIFGMVYTRSKHKWWILATCILAVFLAWGKNFAALNYFLFDHLPLYNKFRAPSMILVIPQLLVPVIGVLALDQLFDKKDTPAYLQSSLKQAGIIAAAIFVVAGIVYATTDYKSENTQRTAKFNQLVEAKSPDFNKQYAALNATLEPRSDNRLYENMVFNTGDQLLAKGLLSALRQDRASVYGKDLVRSLIYAGLTFLVLFLFIRGKISWIPTTIVIGLLLIIDLLLVDKNYLNESSYTEAEQYNTQPFPLTQADQQILADKDPNFRVFNRTTGNPFVETGTSYYHKSIGGQNAAKLGIYNDLINYQLSGSNPNPQVLNMLNTKYVIIPGQQNGAPPQAVRNPDALGNAWFVKGVRFVDDPAAEMLALNNFNPRDTAIVDQSFRNQVPQGQGFQYDSSATIRLTKFDNDTLVYESQANNPQVAVFSEIYYTGGWNLYIDGKPSDYFKANYVLRAAVIPAGKHTIEFRFEPMLWKIGYRVATISSYLIVALLALGIGLELKRRGLSGGKQQTA